MIWLTSNYIGWKGFRLIKIHKTTLIFRYAGYDIFEGYTERRRMYPYGVPVIIHKENPVKPVFLILHREQHLVKS